MGLNCLCTQFPFVKADFTSCHNYGLCCHWFCVPLLFCLFRSDLKLLLFATIIRRIIQSDGLFNLNLMFCRYTFEMKQGLMYVACIHSTVTSAASHVPFVLPMSQVSNFTSNLVNPLS